MSYDPKHAMYHHYKSKGHKTFFIVNLRSKKRFSSFESVPPLPPTMCAKVSFCLYRSTSSNTDDDFVGDDGDNYDGDDGDDDV